MTAERMMAEVCGVTNMTEDVVMFFFSGLLFFVRALTRNGLTLTFIYHPRNIFVTSQLIQRQIEPMAVIFPTGV
jgi:hypothetical protein